MGQQRQNNTLDERNGHRRAETFRHNFRSLLGNRWLSQREAADEIGVPYKWVRRLCHEGVTRADKRTKAGLNDIASFFGLEVEDLWREGATSSSLPRKDRGLIRWTGTKRVQANEIVSQFPEEIATYYEPFLGGGAVLYELLKSDIAVKRFRCSDTCVPLIELWQQIRSDPATVQRRYEEMWTTLGTRGKDFYFEVRDRFNKNHDPCDFFFILRTCRNGFVRFNQKGLFTVGFHHKRNGLPPDEVHSLLQDWHRLLMTHDVTFAVRDYREVSARVRDVIYLDPPYVAQTEIYLGKFDHGELWKWMEQQRGSYLLSLNCDVETLTLDETSKRAGLGGKDGYARAKKVIEKGIPKLVEAMDKGEIAVSAAAELAGLSHDEQTESMKSGVDVGRSFGKLRNARPGESHPPQSEYATPHWLFKFLDAEFNFTLDVASTSENAKCDRFFTLETDGLSQSWGKETVWCNPPFHKDLIGDWVQKAYEESQNGATVVMLIRSRFKDYRWWKDCCIHGQVRFIHEYVRFYRCGQKKKSANEDVTVVIFGPDIVPGSAGPPIITAKVKASQTSDVNHVAFEQSPAALANTPDASADSTPPPHLGTPPTAA